MLTNDLKIVFKILTETLVRFISLCVIVTIKTVVFDS